MTCLFFIFLSICRSSARLSSKWKATKSTFSCFLMIFFEKLSQTKTYS
jgi:hypothetical protein